MRRARASSALWTVGLVMCATIALVGIAAFMMRVHRDARREPSESASPAASPMSGPDNRREAPDVSVPTRPPPSAPARGEFLTPAVRPTLETAIPWLRERHLTIPVAGVDPQSLTPSFSETRGTRVHEALDIMAAAGTPVLAVEDGLVARLFTSQAGGLTIYQFDPTGSVAYYYAHLREYAAGLAEGDAVSRGQVIGYVGSTGNADPDAPHLHFAIFLLGPERRWSEGTAVDPHAVLK